MLAPSLQHVDIAAPFEATRTGLGYTEFGARVRLGGGDSWVLSAQTTVRVPGTFDKNNPAAIGYTDPEVDVRALFGYGFTAGAWPAFSMFSSRSASASAARPTNSARTSRSAYGRRSNGSCCCSRSM